MNQRTGTVCRSGTDHHAIQENKDSMNQVSLRVFLSCATLALLLVLPSCKSPDGTETATVARSADGVVIVDTFRMTATVSAVDPASGKLTLTSPDGAKTTVKAAQGVDDGRFRIGDRVSATVTEEIAVFLGRAGAPLAGAGSAVATDGPNRAVMMANTVQVTARVTEIDMTHRKVTLQFPDGCSKAVKVGRKVDLANVQVGNNGTVQTAESFVLSVERS